MSAPHPRRLLARRRCEVGLLSNHGRRGPGERDRRPSPPTLGRLLEVVHINDLVHLGIKTVEYVLRYLVHAGSREGGDFRGEVRDLLLKALHRSL